MRKSPEQAAADWDAYMASRQPKTESALQIAIVNWCRSLVMRDIIQERFHGDTNGAYLGGNEVRRAIQSARLKAGGMRKGWPDMQFYREPGRSLFLELKNGKAGRLSDEQKELHAKLEDHGFTVLVIRTLDEAKKAISEFYQ